VPVQRRAGRTPPAATPGRGFVEASPRLGFAPASPRFGLASAPGTRASGAGLPALLKANLEAMSGLALDDVRVHRNSSRPAAFGALASTQGSEIHLAPGEERHLPHEGWHVVQQRQGRVKAILQAKGGVALNDDAGLEREADRMGALASSAVTLVGTSARAPVTAATVLQRKPMITDSGGEAVDVATAAAARVAEVLDGFWDSGKIGKITEAVSVAAVQRSDVMDAVSKAVATDMTDRVIRKAKLLVEVIGDLWKRGAKVVRSDLDPALAAAAVDDPPVFVQLKALGGHRLINAVQKAKLGDAKAKEPTEFQKESAEESIGDLTFATAFTDEFIKKHVAVAKTVGKAAKEAHEFREETRKARVDKTKKASAAAASGKKAKKALRSADQAVSTRFLFPAEEQALIVAEVKALNERILATREPNPRAIFRLTKNAYTFVSVYKQGGEESGKARFWYTVLGALGGYQINHLDAIADA
jgi:hypothetical protein